MEEEVCNEDGAIEKQLRIYHSLENSKEYHAEEPQYLIVDFSMLPSLRHLTSAYPDFTEVSSLPHEDEDAKVFFLLESTIYYLYLVIYYISLIHLYHFNYILVIVTYILDLWF